MSAPTHPSKPFYGTSLHVTIVVAPENADKFLELGKPVFDAVTAEPENLFFEVFQDPAQPGYFRFVENWSKDKDWLMNVCFPLTAMSEPNGFFRALYSIYRC